jgi:hypothetical protein
LPHHLSDHFLLWAKCVHPHLLVDATAISHKEVLGNVGGAVARKWGKQSAFSNKP